MKRLEVVSPNHIYHVWDKVKDYLENGLKLSGGEYGVEHLKLYLTSGQQTLLVIIDEEHNIHGAFTVEITNFPNERIAFTTSVGGKGITEQGLWNQYEQWLKDNGVTMIRGAAHETVARLWRRKFGVQSRYIIVEKKLK